MAVLLVQLYACTHVGTMSLQLDFLFDGKVPWIFINVLLNCSHCLYVDSIDKYVTCEHLPICTVLK